MKSAVDTCAAAYVTSLLERIGATLTGVKPGELINISSGDEAHGQWHHAQAALQNFKKVNFIVVKKKKEKMQVFFYHDEALDRTLRNYEIQRFLQGMGYPEDYDLKGYLDILIKKLREKAFPHEIGVFLGYPLKDVMGYLGCSSLELVQVKGWRMYGNREPSLEIYHRFKKAKRDFKNLLHSNRRLILNSAVE